MNWPEAFVTVASLAILALFLWGLDRGEKRDE